MTFCKAIPERLERLRALVDRPLYGPDNEQAHIQEDTLWEAVLEHIAQGKCDDPQKCCERALETGELQFNRWYA